MGRRRFQAVALNWALFPLERLVLRHVKLVMERADKIRYDAKALAQSAHLREGLRRKFAACREPLPPKMDELLKQLDREDHALQREELRS
jgi:hypothetical protein